MLRIFVFVAALGLAASAHPGEVFVTKDAQGRPVYTDKPDCLPAEKINISTKQTDTVEVQGRYEQQMKGYAEADKASAEASKKTSDTRKVAELSAEDKAKRCQEARQNYQNVMNARRLYEPGENEGERRYLDSAEIDAARANARKVMDDFCSGQ